MFEFEVAGLLLADGSFFLDEEFALGAFETDLFEVEVVLDSFHGFDAGVVEDIVIAQSFVRHSNNQYESNFNLIFVRILDFEIKDTYI